MVRKEPDEMDQGTTTTITESANSRSEMVRDEFGLHDGAASITGSEEPGPVFRNETY